MPANYVLLEKVTVGAAGAASVTFNSIPQTGYTDLVIKASARTATGGVDNFAISYNGTTTGYTYREVGGNGSTASSSTGSGQYIGLVNGSTMTASVFSNTEIYIPNYTGGTNKSVMSDAVTENNLTLSYAQMWTSLWSNTAPITQISLASFGGASFAQYSTFTLYGISAKNITPTRSPKATGGSIIQTDGTYWYHAFLASGSFTPATALTCDYLVVAGGGGSGDLSNGAGGGAGGLRSTVGATGGGGSLESSISTASGTVYTVTIGGGGAATANGNNSSIAGSGLTTITSVGGGKGGNGGAGNAGATGGSGGGVYAFPTYSAGAGTANQGFGGGNGNGNPPNYMAGGGGGAGEAGDTDGVGHGGDGVQITAWATPTGTGADSGYYAGGGAGAADAGTFAPGGLGGGGRGGLPQATNSAGGTANTGGGGGGYPRSGGSGIVIIRYPV